MSTETLYATSLTSGTVATSANALGAPNAVFTTDIDNVSWTARFAMGAPTQPAANGTHTVTLRVRKETGTGTPSVTSIALYSAATLIATITAASTNVTSTTGVDVAQTFAASLLAGYDLSTIEVQVATAGVGGSGGARTCIQLDAITWSGDFTAPPNQGSAAGTSTFTGTASGTRTSQGSSTGTSTFTGAATGSAPAPLVGASGSASGTFTFTGSASGARTPKGSAPGASTFTGVASGTRTSAGSSTGTLTFTGTAAGTRTPKGSGSGTATWTGAAVGQRAPQGLATGATTWTGTASGSAPTVGGASGSATGQTTWTGLATGAATHAGAATGLTSWTGAATGSAPAAGTASGSASGSTLWTGTASQSDERPHVEHPLLAISLPAPLIVLTVPNTRVELTQ